MSVFRFSCILVYVIFAAQYYACAQYLIGIGQLNILTVADSSQERTPKGGNTTCLIPILELSGGVVNIYPHTAQVLAMWWLSRNVV